MNKKKLYVDDEQNKELSIFEPLIRATLEGDYVKPECLNIIHLSIFDHWLDEEEASQKIMPYTVVVNLLEQGNCSVNETISLVDSYYQKENKLIALYILLYKNFKIVFFDKKKRSFVSFKDLRSFISLCRKSIREEALLDIYMLEAQCALIGNFDFTLPLYYKDSSKIKDIVSLAQNCGLYILD